MSSILDGIQNLPVWLLLVLVFVVPAAEAAVLFGMFLPGETVVILGGVAANQGSLPLWSVMVVAAAGALIGDQVGFVVGHRYGRRLLDKLPGVAQRRGTIDKALALIERRGWLAVVIGRWTAALRALVPGLAGMSGMPQRQFSLANGVGGVVWAVVVAWVGYLAGESYHAIETRIGRAGEIAAVVVVVLVVVLVAWRHFFRHGEMAVDLAEAEIDAITESDDSEAEPPTTVA